MNPVRKPRPAESSHQVDSESQQTSPQELNDHIYELYKPNGQPIMEILFFHGLQFGHCTDAYLSTWRTGDDSQQVWPGTWLAEVFPHAHIFSVSYDSSMKTTPEQGRLDMFNVAENLMHAICLANIGQGFHSPVILVGHSFGGLVMKQLCVKAHDTQSRDPDSEENQMIAKFLSNVGGLFFYGTPHRGIQFPDIGAEVLDVPLLVYAQLLSKEAARLQTEFDTVSKKYKTWRIAGVGESHQTSLGRYHGVVVPEASARYGADFCTVAADHISLCKPANKTSISFQRLVYFISVFKVQGEGCFENIQPLPRAAIGLDVGVEKVREMLNQERATVGIVGMGGVGKTTLARAVFNKLLPAFEYSCFLLEVKLMTGDVKTKIWQHMYCRGKKVADEQHGLSQLRGKQLLLVLDDVAYNNGTGFRDLDVLSDIVNMVGPGSRFIATSRDKELLKRLDNVKLYEIPFLNEKDAKQLFMGYALKNKVLPPSLSERLVEDVVKKCDGLPLTLEIVGKYLKKKKKNVEKHFQETLQALDKAESVFEGDEILWAKLMISYYSLKEKEQQMFLDATTFFYNWDLPLYVAKAAWSVSYGYEETLWSNLVNASLVYDVNEDEPIKVHEQLQSLGRRIAADCAGKVGKCRRVWEETEGLKLLQSTEESDDQEILALRVSDRDLDHVNIARSFLCRLQKLQYLDGGLPYSKQFWDSLKHIVHQRQKIFPKTLQTALVLLRYPSFHWGPLLFDLGLLPRLAVLELSHYDQESLPSSFTQLSELKILTINSAPSLSTLPDEIGRLSKLERLQLHGCVSLTALPETFGSLCKLKVLYLSGCVKLLSLPQSFEGLSALNYLSLSCPKLHSLPHSFGKLSALNHLGFHSGELCTLPKSFGGLSTLSRLILSGCQELCTLPDSFGELSSLNYLVFDSCLKLCTLPESFGELSALNHLKFSNCHALCTLPECFGGLSSLNYLEFYDCSKFHTLPDSFGNLSALNNLNVFACDFLTLPESFGRLSALNYLKFSHCRQLCTLPESFGGLSALNYLELDYCPNFHTLPNSFGNLSSLNHLEFSHCRSLRSLPKSFGGLFTLNHLVFDNCLELGTLPESFGGLSALNHLVIRKCSKFHTLPDSFGNLSALDNLIISGCHDLGSLPDSFGNLSALDNLIISGCNDLGSLPESFGQLVRLDYLKLKWLPLKWLPDSFSELKAVRKLVIKNLALASVPDYMESWPSSNILNNLCAYADR